MGTKIEKHVMISFSNVSAAHDPKMDLWVDVAFEYAVKECASVTTGANLLQNGIMDFFLEEAKDIETPITIYTPDLLAQNLFDVDFEKIKNFTSKKGREYIPVKKGEGLAEQLSEMRKIMVKTPNVFFVAGGKKEGYLGKMPGIQEELDLILDRIKALEKIYLVIYTQFGGVAASYGHMIIYDDDLKNYAHVVVLDSEYGSDFLDIKFDILEENNQTHKSIIVIVE